MRTPADMAKELDNEDIEVKGHMIEAEDEVQETEPVEQPDTEPEPVAEPAKEQPSYLDDLDEEEEQPRKTAHVPVSALQKERQKRQEAEARRKEAEERLAQLEQQEQEFDISADLQGILESDDDFVDKKVFTEVLNKAGRRIAKETRDKVLQDIQTETQKAARKQQMQVLQDKARQAIPDFDAVVQAAIDTGSMTRAELQSVYSAKDPARALYRKAKEVLNVFGIQPKAVPVTRKKGSENQTQIEDAPEEAESEVMDDESFYTKVFRQA